MIASDGHTYELAALGQCATAPASPATTRQELQPRVVYNRAAHETDKQLTSALHQVRARRTNRRWQAQATGGVRACVCDCGCG